MASQEIATLAGGCFWCLEAVFKDIKGVIRAVSGYMGGRRDNPSYEQVCTGATGHAEAVQITFDPAVIGYSDLLDVFFTIHDPTQLNRQGHDVGTQYRSAIFYHSPEQKKAAQEAVRSAAELWDAEIVTEVTEASTFWPAEDYHQNYFENNPQNPYCSAVVAPKLAKARSKWAKMLKSSAA